MRILDFTGQTLMLAAALLCLTFGKEGLVFIAFVQFFMGSWQVLSAIITSFRRNHGDAQRTLMIRIYWIAVLFYFLGLALLGFVIDEQKELFYGWFLSAWMIAIYYYVITIRIAFLHRERKTFLDIAN